MNCIAIVHPINIASRPPDLMAKLTTIYMPWEMEIVNVVPAAFTIQPYVYVFIVTTHNNHGHTSTFWIWRHFRVLLPQSQTWVTVCLGFCMSTLCPCGFPSGSPVFSPLPKTCQLVERLTPRRWMCVYMVSKPDCMLVLHLVFPELAMDPLQPGPG